MSLLLDNVCLQDLDILHRLIFTVRSYQTELLDRLHAALDPPKNRMLAIQPRRWCKSDEELRAICVGSRVGHAEDTCARMLQCWRDLVLELLAINGFSTSTGACGITALDHKVRYYAVKYEAVEVVALRKGREVLACFGRMVVVKLDSNETLY